MSSESIGRVLALPCPSCGGKLVYSAEKRRIYCPFCGHQEEPDQSNDKVQELSLKDALQKASVYRPEEAGRKVFLCEGCGSRLMIEPRDVRIVCGFCGSNKVNEEAFDHTFIQPQGVIPFYISRDDAAERFKVWIGQGWFHPNKLKRLARIENLHGVYLPFWTYDAQTESDWQGEAGYYYYETETVWVNGKAETRQVQKINWVWRSGHLSHFFDDVLIVASKGYPHGKIQDIYPYRLNEVINFDPRLLLGWEGEVYDIEVDAGYGIADRVMDGRIRGMCSAALGGDTQRGLSVSTNKSGQTFKHLVLPIWICAYMYNNKIFQFAVNGQTGKIAGHKPLSWIKITLLVLLIALIAGDLYYYFEIYQKQQGNISL